METIDSWLDASEVRRLADRLLTPIPQSGQPHAHVVPETVGISDISRQLGTFRSWMREQVGARHAFLLHGDSEVIFDDSGKSRFSNLARGFTVSAWFNQSTPRSLRVQIAPGTLLEIIPVEHHGRRYALGAVVDVPLKPESLRVIIESLQGQLV